MTGTREGDNGSSGQPTGSWRDAVESTDKTIIAKNALHPESPTEKQVYYVYGRCERHGVSVAQLLEWAGELGRLIPKSVEGDGGLDDLRALTKSEIGALFEIVHAWDEYGLG